MLTSLAKTIRDYHLPFCHVKLLLNGEMIGNCFFFKKDDNTKTKKIASFLRFFLGKEREADRSRLSGNINAIKGIYHNGMIGLIEKPETQETSEILEIFLEKKKIPIFEAVEILLEIH